jgi:hypothetical protein
MCQHVHTKKINLHPLIVYSSFWLSLLPGINYEKRQAMSHQDCLQDDLDFWEQMKVQFNTPAKWRREEISVSNGNYQCRCVIGSSRNLASIHNKRFGCQDAT